MIRTPHARRGFPINKTQFWGWGSRGGGMAFSMLNVILLARILQPGIYGEYAFLLTLVEILTILALLGTPSLITREVSSGISGRSFFLVKGVLRWSRAVTALGSLVISAAALTVLYFNKGGIIQSLGLAGLLFGISLVMIDSFMNQNYCTLQGLHKIILPQVLSNLLVPGLFFLSLVIVFLLAPGHWNVDLIFFFLFLTRLLVMVASEFFKNRLLPNDVKAVVPEFQARKWISSALPLLGVGLMVIINRRIDIIMLGFLASARDIGIYRVAQRGAEILLIGIMAVDAELNPIVARDLDKGEKKGLQAIISKSIWSSLVITLPLALLFIFGGKPLISLIYGDAYTPAAVPLAILSSGYLSLCFLGRGNVILTMGRFEKYTLMAVAIGAGLNIFLNVLLIPGYGINGAAAATAISIAVRMMVEAYYAYRLTGIDTTLLSAVNFSGRTAKGRDLK
jgi:O-antigen/teichoic acid export membrane protein